MIVLHLETPENLTTLPLIELSRDWHGDAISAPPRYLFALDATHFHFCATRSGPSTVHPSSTPGVFQAELWKSDVAEFFLRHPTSDDYLEINLAPNGGWWSCLFSAPRVRRTDREEPIPGVLASATCDESGWRAQIAIPLPFLRKTLAFGPSSRLHAAFLLDSPQRCLTSATPPPLAPDFHHPDLPQPVTIARP